MEQSEIQGYVGSPFQEEAGALIPRAEDIPLYEENAEVLRRQEEIAEDEEVIEHFRRQIKKADGRQKMSEIHEVIETSLPAKSHIPVTTPRLSTSPKRPKSSEKLFQEKEPLPDVGEIPDTPGRDRDMTKLYMQVSAAAERETDDVTVTKKREEKERISEKKEDKPKEDRQQEEKVEDGRPIQPGSLDANIIIADFMSTKHASKSGIFLFNIQFYFTCKK